MAMTLKDELEGLRHEVIELRALVERLIMRLPPQMDVWPPRPDPPPISGQMMRELEALIAHWRERGFTYVADELERLVKPVIVIG